MTVSGTGHGHGVCRNGTSMPRPGAGHTAATCIRPCRMPMNQRRPSLSVPPVGDFAKQHRSADDHSRPSTAGTSSQSACRLAGVLEQAEQRAHERGLQTAEQRRRSRGCGSGSRAKTPAAYPRDRFLRRERRLELVCLDRLGLFAGDAGRGRDLDALGQPVRRVQVRAAASTVDQLAVRRPRSGRSGAGRRRASP